MWETGSKPISAQSLPKDLLGNSISLRLWPLEISGDLLPVPGRGGSENPGGRAVA